MTFTFDISIANAGLRCVLVANEDKTQGSYLILMLVAFF